MSRMSADYICYISCYHVLLQSILFHFTSDLLAFSKVYGDKLMCEEGSIQDSYGSRCYDIITLLMFYVMCLQINGK